MLFYIRYGAQGVDTDMDYGNGKMKGRRTTRGLLSIKLVD